MGTRNLFAFYYSCFLIICKEKNKEEREGEKKILEAY
jgi:hypothetical protein